jgi:phage portal protein BeeE
MLPIITAYEQELNKKLLSIDERKKGYEFRFDMQAILRADSVSRAAENQRAVRGGWKTINDIRKEEGRPGIKGGDNPLVARDLTTLDAILTIAEGEKKKVELIGKETESTSSNQE